MLKKGFAKKTTILEQFFFILLLIEGHLTKLPRENFFSAYRFVFRLKIMVKKSKKWSKMTFRRIYFTFL
jgi:hypothetical protein